MQNVEDATRWIWLYEKLEDAAKSRRIFGEVPKRTEIVLSDNVKAFIDNRFTAFPGQTTVCYGASGCGKTTSAVYLLRGDYPHRPEYAIMIEAEGSSDIATSFAKRMSAPAAASQIVSILVAAVMLPTETESTAKKLKGDISKWLRRLNCVSPSIGEPANIIARPPFTPNNGVDPSYKIPPLIIIDDLPRSDLNCEFIGRLYTAADAAQVNVLILTKDREWANTMITINGGVKILPMEEVIDNPRERFDARFTETPIWTGMYWDEQDIEALVELDQVGNIELHAEMTPRQVFQQHFARTHARRGRLRFREYEAL